jgi:hypothetical protein
MMFRTALPVLMAAALIASGCSVAVADEIFVCDRNRIVTATPQTLETLKRTDACVAAYFGLDVEAGVQTAAVRDDVQSIPFTREVFIGVEAVGAAPEAPHERLIRLNPADLAKAAKRQGSGTLPKLKEKPTRVGNPAKRAGGPAYPVGAATEGALPVVHVINAGS